MADEFIASRETTGVSDAYVRSCRHNLKKSTDRIPGNISDVTVIEINRFLSKLKNLGPVSRNTIRRNLITMFGCAKKQGYLHPYRKAEPELSESFKVPTRKIENFTPDEMESVLLAAHARILPLIAIGGFAGFRSAEILRLDWEDIKRDRGHIELAGSKAKTVARRLVPLTDNLKAGLDPWRQETGRIVSLADSDSQHLVEPRLMKRQEFTRRLSVSVRTLDNWMAKRVIAYIQIHPKFHLFDFEAVSRR